MLIVAGGLQRTGSTWIWQMLGDVVEANGGIIAPRNNNVMYWAQEWANSDDTYLCKTHTYKSTFDDVIDKIKVVMTVRDPRDLVCSFAYLMETTPQKILYSGKFDRLIESWRVWKEKIPVEQLLEIRYEDLVRDPEHKLWEAQTFLDFPTLSGISDITSKWSIENNRIRTKHPYKLQDRQYLYRRLISDGKVNKFYKEMTLSQIKRTQEVCLDYMEEYGYAVEDLED